MMQFRDWVFALILTLCLFSPVHAMEGGDRLAFIGLHGGVFAQIESFEEELGIEVTYLTDEELASGSLALSVYRAVFLQHLRDDLREQYTTLFSAAQLGNPDLRIFDISGGAKKRLPKMVESGAIEVDPAMKAYYGSSPENLRRLLRYTQITYLGGAGEVQSPEEVVLTGLYHPDHEGNFQDVKAFLEWERSRVAEGDSDPAQPLVAIAVHSTHLAFQQPGVVRALIAECERQGARAVAVIDLKPGAEQLFLDLAPDVVVHTCHTRDGVPFRQELGVPHLHSVFFRKQSIGAWQDGADAFAPNELALQVASQEMLGAIEPHAAAGTTLGGGSEQAFLPIDERINRLVTRALAWAQLAKKPNAEKRIAIVYYDRELGKAELMRGSATGMFLNGPRSLVNVLRAMADAGYDISDVPVDEDELVGWMMERGRQIGVWAPDVLERLATSGEAVLVPVAKYQAWLDERVPAKRRAELVAAWGEAPGDFLAWEKDGEQFLVIPRIDLGAITLLPQPLRGEAQDTSKTHDKLVPPPHNYLATYFWLEEEFGADAFVHFGTHGSEFMLPGRGAGLGPDDWTEIVMGTTPNVQPWVINNLGESGPVRRRAHAVLVDHLVPPSVAAELSDELYNLHVEIDKWVTLSEGALELEFRESITRQVREESLDVDLKFTLAEGQVLDNTQIMALLEHLHAIHIETTPISLHTMGEAPPRSSIAPWIVTCLRGEFLDALELVVEVPAGESLTDGDRQKYLRGVAERAVELVVHKGASIEAALLGVGATVILPEDWESGPKEAGSSETNPKELIQVPGELRSGFELALELAAGFAQAGNEIDGILGALDGKFVEPGPGNAPDRNPAVLPTGRNMFTLNPEEIPSRPSWELGKRLIDDLLGARLEQDQSYPAKVGFTLSSFSTFEDYGVMESQILYLLGVRPVWDARNLVVGVELIPREELGRPRIDVFIASGGYYRDVLPSRMRLIDKALTLVGALDEEHNQVFAAAQRVEQELLAQGENPERAKLLSLARIFGAPLNQTGSAGYYYLVERSGEWGSREELAETYISHSQYVYTAGAWGEDAGAAYERQIQGTDTVIRSWSDRTRSPLSNKYFWYRGGSLSLAIEYLTGSEPQFLLSDVRDPDRARMVSAKDALRVDLRARLFNRKWIEGMMDEGYAGADQVAVHVSNAMGWEIMRPDSITDDVWEEIVEIFVRDSKQLDIREWFEDENPFAFQELTEVLLEVARKGYWQPSEETLADLVEAYTESVAKHGEGAGLRGGGNTDLQRFVQAALAAPGGLALAKPVDVAHEASAQEAGSAEPAASTEPASAPGASSANMESVTGPVLQPKPAPPPQVPEDPWPLAAVLAGAALLLGLGFTLRIGAPNH